MTPTRIAYCFLVDKLKETPLCKGLHPPEMSKIVNAVSSMHQHIYKCNLNKRSALGQNITQLHTGETCTEEKATILCFAITYLISKTAFLSISRLQSNR